jgi:hypothetical protein
MNALSPITMPVDLRAEQFRVDSWELAQARACLAISRAKGLQWSTERNRNWVVQLYLRQRRNRRLA